MKIIKYGVIILALAVAAFQPYALMASGSDRPNIIFIFADDWGWGDLSCHGHPYLKTPNIDRLASEGTDFQRFTVASGVCSPSRTGVMTGHFPGRYLVNGHFAYVHSNESRNMPDWLSPDAPMLPRFLKKAGYATAHYGKWHLSNDMIPDAPLISEYGYDDYGAFNCSGPQMMVHDDVKSALRFIDKAVSEDKPFFINLWMHESHTPHHVNAKIQTLYPDLEETDNIYASIIHHADQRVGILLDALDEYGIEDDTLVIFSSDNGPAGSGKNLALYYDTATGPGYNTAASKGVTGGRRGKKASLLEGGIGVPFLVRWPGKVKAGVVDETALISAVDLLPTFCELAGAELPRDYEPDGVSQVRSLMGDVQPGRDKPLFWMKSLKKGKVTNEAYAVVHKRWKMISDSNFDKVELFDITGDPYEASDLQGEHPEIVAELKGLLKNWKKTLPNKPDTNCFSKWRNKPAIK